MTDVKFISRQGWMVTKDAPNGWDSTIKLKIYDKDGKLAEYSDETVESLQYIDDVIQLESEFDVLTSLSQILQGLVKHLEYDNRIYDYIDD